MKKIELRPRIFEADEEAVERAIETIFCLSSEVWYDHGTFLIPFS